MPAARPRTQLARVALLASGLLLGGLSASSLAAQQDHGGPHDHDGNTGPVAARSDSAYSIIPDLAAHGHALLAGGATGMQQTHLLATDDGSEVILFAMPPGALFPEHAAPRDVIIQVVEGRATVTLGDGSTEAGPGSWIRMDPGLPHSLQAESPFIFLVYASPPRR